MTSFFSFILSQEVFPSHQYYIIISYRNCLHKITFRNFWSAAIIDNEAVNLCCLKSSKLSLLLCRKQTASVGLTRKQPQSGFMFLHSNGAALPCLLLVQPTMSIYVYQEIKMVKSPHFLKEYLKVLLYFTSPLIAAPKNNIYINKE